MKPKQQRWNEVHVDGRKKARWDGNGSVNEWRRKRAKEAWLRGKNSNIYISLLFYVSPRHHNTYSLDIQILNILQ